MSINYQELLKEAVMLFKKCEFVYNSLDEYNATCPICGYGTYHCKKLNTELDKKD